MTRFNCYINKILGLYQNKYNKNWDILLNKLIENGELIDISYYTASIKLGEDVFEIWVRNKPYASHSLRKKNGEIIPEELKFSPSIKTQLKFEKWVSAYQQKKLIKGIIKIYGDTND